MSQRRPPGQSSRQTWNDLLEGVSSFQSEQLMEGVVAACALVAYADGWVTEEERRRMLGLIHGFEPIAAFGLDGVHNAFEALTERFIEDHEETERAALAAVARLRGKQRYPALLVKICCAIAAADGGFDAEERIAAIRICNELALDPADFGIADAP